MDPEISAWWRQVLPAHLATITGPGLSSSTRMSGPTLLERRIGLLNFENETLFWNVWALRIKTDPNSSSIAPRNPRGTHLWHPMSLARHQHTTKKTGGPYRAAHLNVCVCVATNLLSTHTTASAFEEPWLRLQTLRSLSVVPILFGLPPHLNPKARHATPHDNVLTSFARRRRLTTSKPPHSLIPQCVYLFIVVVGLFVAGRILAVTVTGGGYTCKTRQTDR